MQWPAKFLAFRIDEDPLSIRLSSIGMHQSVSISFSLVSNILFLQSSIFLSSSTIFHAPHQLSINLYILSLSHRVSLNLNHTQTSPLSGTDRTLIYTSLPSKTASDGTWSSICAPPFSPVFTMLKCCILCGHSCNVGG